jgi:hypothetical protein
MSASYRSRLEALEQSIQPTKPVSPMMIYGIYASIIVIWLIVLVSFTPSFLYTTKRKRKPAKRDWSKIIIVWILLSAATCGALFWYKK